MATAFPGTGWDAAAYVTLTVGVLALVGVLVTAVVALVTSNRATRARANNDRRERWWERAQWAMERACDPDPTKRAVRSEEHTSELQSLRHLVCRLLLEKKKKKIKSNYTIKKKKKNKK